MDKTTDNAYLETLGAVDWDTFYQEKMALQNITDYLHRNKEQENGMFGRAANWMEGILTMMDNLGDAAEDENDRCLDNRFNDVLDRSPDAAM